MFHIPAHKNLRNPPAQYFPNDDDDSRDQHDEPHQRFDLDRLIDAISAVNPEEIEQFTDEIDHAY